MKRSNGPEPTEAIPPKPRKNAKLWQAYQMWNEMVELRKRHLLRISSVERGVSQFDAEFEQDFIERTALDRLIDYYRKEMIEFGSDVAPWSWLTSIRGLKEGSLAAQLLAQIDDITSFTNVSKLWRFCGMAVVDGKAEGLTSGEKAHYNRKLKSICWLISDQFVKQNTPVYRGIYDAEKERQRELHPEPVKRAKAIGKITHDYTPAHIDAMARRKAVKIFLQHLWLMWREEEGLPTNEPFVIAQLQHSDYIAPAGL